VSTNKNGEPLVLVERRGHVGILTLNRPEARNAVDMALTEAIAEAVVELEGDDQVWVLVLSGAGDKSFCAGADLKETARGDFDATRMKELGGWAAITQRTFLKPVIAAVNGTALGGGTEICLACDLVVADDHATFGLPEVRQGLVAAAGGLERLARRVPPAIAMELILTGVPIGAQRALELGLVNRVVPRGTCVEAAVALAEVVCEASPLAVRYSKAVARASFTFAEADIAGTARDLRRAVFKSEDFKEGPRAFAEKRKPIWKGR
jgi:enoyl-CoA hydratase/carnithine racemase